MDIFNVQELLEICEELNISVGSLKQKKHILELLENEEVSLEEAGEARETILEKKEERERLAREEREAILEKKEERERLARKEKEEREERERIENEHSVQMKILEKKIQVLKWQKVRAMMQEFSEGDSIISFLAAYEQVCLKFKLDRDYWSIALTSVLPIHASDVLARLPDEKFKNYDTARKALFRHFGVPFRNEIEIGTQMIPSRESDVLETAHDVKASGKRGSAYQAQEVVCYSFEEQGFIAMNTVKEVVFAITQDPDDSEVDAMRCEPVLPEVKAFIEANEVPVDDISESEGHTDPSRESDVFERARDSEAFVDSARELQEQGVVVCYNLEEQGHIAMSCEKKVAFATTWDTKDPEAALMGCESASHEVKAVVETKQELFAPHKREIACAHTDPSKESDVQGDHSREEKEQKLAFCEVALKGACVHESAKALDVESMEDSATARLDLWAILQGVPREDEAGFRGTNEFSEGLEPFLRPQHSSDLEESQRVDTVSVAAGRSKGTMFRKKTAVGCRTGPSTGGEGPFLPLRLRFPLLGKEERPRCRMNRDSGAQFMALALCCPQRVRKPSGLRPHRARLK